MRGRYVILSAAEVPRDLGREHGSGARRLEQLAAWRLIVTREVQTGLSRVWGGEAACIESSCVQQPLEPRRVTRRGDHDVHVHRRTIVEHDATRREARDVRTYGDASGLELLEKADVDHRRTA